MIDEVAVNAFTELCQFYAKMKVTVLDRQAIMQKKLPEHPEPEPHEALILFDEPTGHQTNLHRWLNMIASIKYPESIQIPHTRIHKSDWSFGLLNGEVATIGTCWADAILMYELWDRKHLPPEMGGGGTGACLRIFLKDRQSYLRELINTVASVGKYGADVDSLLNTFELTYTAGEAISMLDLVIAHGSAVGKTL